MLYNAHWNDDQENGKVRVNDKTFVEKMLRRIDTVSAVDANKFSSA